MLTDSKPGIKIKFEQFFRDIHRKKTKSLFRRNRQMYVPWISPHPPTISFSDSLAQLCGCLNKMYVSTDSGIDRLPTHENQARIAETLRTLRQALLTLSTHAKANYIEHMHKSRFFDWTAHLLGAGLKQCPVILEELTWIWIIALVFSDDSSATALLRQTDIVCHAHGLLDHPSVEVFSNSVWILGTVLAIDLTYQPVFAEFCMLKQIHQRVAHFEQSSEVSSSVYRGYLVFVSEYFGAPPMLHDQRVILVTLDKVLDIFSDFKEACIFRFQDELMLSLYHLVRRLETIYVRLLLQEPKMVVFLADLVTNFESTDDLVQSVGLELFLILSRNANSEMARLFEKKHIQETLIRMLSGEDSQQTVTQLMSNLLADASLAVSFFQNNNSRVIPKVLGLLEDSGDPRDSALTGPVLQLLQNFCNAGSLMEEYFLANSGKQD